MDPSEKKRKNYNGTKTPEKLRRTGDYIYAKPIQAVTRNFTRTGSYCKVTEPKSPELVPVFSSDAVKEVLIYFCDIAPRVRFEIDGNRHGVSTGGFMGVYNSKEILRRQRATFF